MSDYANETAGFTVLQDCAAFSEWEERRITCSQSCGPFVNYTVSWEALPRAVSQLPTGGRRFFLGVSSEVFAISFFVITCLAVFYVIALAGAHKRVISQLREQLAMEGRDKRFLIQKLCQAQRSSGVQSPHSSQSQSQSQSPPDRHSLSPSTTYPYSSGLFLVQPSPDSYTHV